MKKLIVAIAIAMLAGCVSLPPQIEVSDRSSPELIAKEIVVSNFIVRQKYSPTSHTWSGSFNVLPNAVTVPDFDKLVVKKIETELVGDADNGNGRLIISVLSAGLYMESHIADSVPFVGIASAFRVRGYKCLVDVNFEYEGRSVRKSFESETTRDRLFGDLETPDVKIMVERFLGEVSNQIHAFATAYVASESR